MRESQRISDFLLFRDIALTRSFSRAAAMSGISQSAASQQVQELERVLQVTLIDRSRRPLVVTSAGELYAEFCRDVIRRKQDFDTALGRLRDKTGAADVEGIVRVASIYSVGVSELIQLEKRFTELHPHSEVAIAYLQPGKVYAAVLEDQADLGLVSYPEPSRELNVIPWRREEMVLAASPDHPIARQAAAHQGPLPITELEGVDFVGLDEELPIRQHVDRFFREKNVKVNLSLHFDNIEMVKQAVAHDAGVSILPYRAMREELRQKRLTAIRLAGAVLYRPLGIIHRKKKQFHPVMQAFLEMLTEAPVPDVLGS
ncbi:MAG: LysR family transcriptional regulator [Acidobacteriota bacterium]